jgi:multisubunit Na+/H+ antiporter MnhC subunit
MSKRHLAAGICASASALFIVAAAHAQGAVKTYTDPQNRFTLQHPANWPVDPLPGSTAPNTGIVIGVAAAECKIVTVPRTESAGKSADAVRRAYTAPIGRAEWKNAADGLNIWNDKGIVTADAVDTAKFWPVQTASFTTDEGKPGYGVMQARPGIDVWMFCSSYDNTDRKAIFDRIFGSFAGPNDAALEAAAKTESAQRAAEEAAAEAAKAAPKEQPKAQKEKKTRSSLRSARGE